MAQQKSKYAVTTLALMTEVAMKFDTISTKKIKEVLKLFLLVIEENIVNGNTVRIDRVGIFRLKDLAARMSRNPKTGKNVKLLHRKKVAFRIALSLRQLIEINPKRRTAPKKNKQ
jgi:nucleoid DNA-binding protein